MESANSIKLDSTNSYFLSTDFPFDVAASDVGGSRDALSGESRFCKFWNTENGNQQNFKINKTRLNLRAIDNAGL